MMIVLEDNIEFEFLINTPIVGQAIASLPTNEIQTNDIIQTNDTQTNDDATVNTNEQASTDGETITNVEDLFN